MDDLYREMEEERVIGRKRRSVIRKTALQRVIPCTPEKLSSAGLIRLLFLEAGL